MSATSLLGQTLALRRKVAAERPDLVHATLMRSCLVSRVAMIGARPPLLNSVVNLFYDPRRADDDHVLQAKLRVLRAADGFTIRHLVDHVHALTASVADEVIRKLRVKASKITIIPRGRSRTALGASSEERRRFVRRELAVDDTAALVINVGRQDHPKAQVLLVHSFARVLRQRPDAVLVIVGRDGTATPELHATVQRQGVADRVRFLGHRTDVFDLVAAADVFAFPSHYEGLGCALIEAMALRVPIVASDAAAVSEVLSGGQCGLIVPRGDEVALAQAINQILDDRSLAAVLAATAYERFLCNYELDKVADATVALYRELCGAVGGHRCAGTDRAPNDRSDGNRPGGWADPR